MLTELSQQIDDFIQTSRVLMPTMLEWLAILWGINLINWIALGGRLNALGVRPRRARGLIGILFSPILHADFTHLLFNSLPLFFLALFIMTMGAQQFYIATVIIALLSGIGVWLCGRRGNHIGASGVIAGYFGYILANAYQRPTFTALFAAAVALYYFGGILLSLFPGRPEMSWEGHLAGFLSGIVAMLLIQYGPYLWLTLQYYL